MRYWRMVWVCRRSARTRRPSTQVGLAESITTTCPVIENDLHIGAARLAMREENARYLTAVMEGKYTERYLRRLGADAPKFTDAEMKAIGSPLDFVGINCYAPEFVRADGSDKGYQGGAAAEVVSAHGVAVAVCGAGRIVLGAEAG